jgi:hypothetical protein
VTDALSGHAAARDLMEFPMDERDQSLAGVVVSLPPLEEERGDLCGSGGNPDILGATIPWHWTILRPLQLLVSGSRFLDQEELL